VFYEAPSQPSNNLSRGECEEKGTVSFLNPSNNVSSESSSAHDDRIGGVKGGVLKGKEELITNMKKELIQKATIVEELKRKVVILENELDHMWSFFPECCQVVEQPRIPMSDRFDCA